ncbi:MAG: glycerophosphodiester phosphodiesterase [Betaproteobacteria bacterium HGW-Betaproteobacteria-11]|nr:MAG: glycerophosphodiester phosphodiesterase [Betaproteobacteria bacterium HGW-Betaproteobacteria-11]
MTPYPRIIAHRGGGALAPENTLAGLRIAHRLGCRGVEFDVMLTADGVPVLMHDETLERTTDGQGALAAVTAAELTCLDAGSKYHPAFAGERAPTFFEALALCAELGLWVNAELKPAAGAEVATGHAAARAVIERASSLVPGNLVFSSFSMPALQAAREIAPAVPRALLCESIPEDLTTQLAACAATALHVAASAVTPALVAPICNRGIPVACYTVNDRGTVERLFAMGVATVFSDRIDLWQPDEM